MGINHIHGYYIIYEQTIIFVLCLYKLLVMMDFLNNNNMNPNTPVLISATLSLSDESIYRLVNIISLCRGSNVT